METNEDSFSVTMMGNFLNVGNESSSQKYRHFYLDSSFADNFVEAPYKRYILLLQKLNE